MEIVYVLSGVLSGALVMFLAVVFRQRIKKKKQIRRLSNEADKILSRAKSEAHNIEKRARSFEHNIKKNAQKDVERQKARVSNELRSLKAKEQKINETANKNKLYLKEKEQALKSEFSKIEHLRSKILSKEDELKKETLKLADKLENISGISKEEATKEVIKAAKEEAKSEATRISLQIEKEAREDAERKAKKILALAAARYSGEYSAERTTSVVELENEEVKGKIIGREGRNIRALETICGVDLVVDDTPELVVISAFDPVRREVAKRSLEKLMEDGRIHPARIEEIVNKVKNELFKSIKRDGEKLALELGLSGLNPEIIKLVGSLKYRTSYTQNNYVHSREVAYFAGIMAAELGVATKPAMRAGLLHDIGKALDHSIEGGHAVIGADFAKRHGETEEVCHAIRAHHEDEKPRTALAYIVIAADALSGARPGARRQTMESYVKRLEDLESIGNSFDGVIRTFAIQAGREVRVLVEGSRVNDEQALMLSRDIARKIEREMNFPGQIKITVVRETRAIEHAR